jgi:crossover junction endodeoxyribonuclease RuvC
VVERAARTASARGPRRIVAFDPGTARTGYGIIETEGNRLTAVGHGLIETPAGESAAHRLDLLATKVERVLAEAGAAEAAVERLFFATNTTTAMAVAEARGVIMLACARAKLPTSEYTPLQVKQSVAAYGQAGKQQVAAMVVRLLNLKETPKPDDVTDALAVAICHSGNRLPNAIR